MILVLGATLMLGCASEIGPGYVATGPGVGRTAHFDLRCESGDASELGQLLEAQHALLRSWYGKAPVKLGERLRFAMLADSKSFTKALVADHQDESRGAGGFYGPTVRTAYTYPQPSEYFSRHIALHEAAHQFHFLTSTGNKAPAAGDWYTEGLAEYFAMHNWDGKRLELGVIPAVTLEDYPARALAELGGVDWDLEGVISGRHKVKRPAGWAVVDYLMHEEPQKARQYFAKLDGGAEAVVAWREVFGPIGPERRGALRRWVERRQQAWRSVWNEWQERGETIEGHSEVVGLAVLKGETSRIGVEMEWVSVGGSAGLIAGYRSPEDFYFAEVFRETGKLRIARRLGKGWTEARDFALPGGGGGSGKRMIELRRRGALTEVWVGDAKVTELRVTGQMGVGVNGGRVRFTVKAE